MGIRLSSAGIWRRSTPMTRRSVERRIWDVGGPFDCFELEDEYLS